MVRPRLLGMRTLNPKGLGSQRKRLQLRRPPEPRRPKPKRAGQAGVIEFSSDAGKTWTLQPSGVIADLLAGSAPSDKICWIVGRSGTVLRTTDGGKHWRKLRPPAQDDLRSVFAVDARQATVSPNNGAYQTTDGGATWTKLPPE